MTMTSSDSILVRRLSQSPPAKRPAMDPPSSSDSLNKRVKFSHDTADREHERTPLLDPNADDPDANVEPDIIADRQTRQGQNMDPCEKRDATGTPRPRKGKSRANRPRRGTRAESPQPQNDGEAQEGEQDPQTPKPPRLPKRQTALLLGFCGTGCSGMQM